MSGAREQAIAATRKKVGWAYSELSWFSEEEARLADRRRNDLLDALDGWAESSFEGSKPHSGPLSPGCMICGAGGWGCNYVNCRCTRDCFFCPQDRSVKTEHESMTAGNLFAEPADHVRYLEALGIRGVGFTGGEPLLVLSRLLAHIEAIREELGSSIYLWLYTNGDKAGTTALRQLRDAGLDEIRFNLAAREYDLEPVARAKRFIPTVTVEIPAVPEDLELLKGLLGELEAHGVDFLNLHQLYATRHNYKALSDRGYHFLHQPSVPVFESEICALELLLYARETGVGLPIQYCSSSYKNRFQARDVMTQLARVVTRGCEQVTRAGYIRSFRLSGSMNAIQEVVRRLEVSGNGEGLWRQDPRRGGLMIHCDLLPQVDSSAVDVSVVYSTPGVELKDETAGFTGANILPANSVEREHRFESRLGLDYWRRLYVEGADPREALETFFEESSFAYRDDVAGFRREALALSGLRQWEEVASGMPEIY